MRRSIPDPGPATYRCWKFPFIIFTQDNSVLESILADLSEYIRKSHPCLARGSGSRTCLVALYPVCLGGPPLPTKHLPWPHPCPVLHDSSTKPLPWLATVLSSLSIETEALSQNPGWLVWDSISLFTLSLPKAGTLPWVGALIHAGWAPCGDPASPTHLTARFAIAMATPWPVGLDPMDNEAFPACTHISF